MVLDDKELKKLSIFKLLLYRFLNNKNNYKDIVEKVITDTHLLSNGEKNFYNIDRDNYFIISYLFKTNKELYQKEINNDTYIETMNILNNI